MKDKKYDNFNKCSKCFWQNSTLIYDKSSKKLGIEGTYINIIKSIYDKPALKIILSCKNLKVFPLRSQTRQGCSLSIVLFGIGLEVHSSGSSWHSKKKKWKESRLEKKKYNCYCLQMTWYYTQKILKMASENY